MNQPTTCKDFFAPGIPVTEGSTKAFKHSKTGRVTVRHNNADKLKAWRKTIIAHAAKAHLIPPTGYLYPRPRPVRVSVTFLLPRPKRTQADVPVVKPDLDKLLRAVGDALTDARIVEDDAQIIQASAWKLYAPQDKHVGALISLIDGGGTLSSLVQQDATWRINQVMGWDDDTPNPWGEL